MIQPFERTEFRRTGANVTHFRKTQLQSCGPCSWDMRIRTLRGITLAEDRIHFQASIDLQSSIIHKYERKVWHLGEQPLSNMMVYFIMDPICFPEIQEIEFDNSNRYDIEYTKSMSLLYEEIINHQKECAVRSRKLD